MNGQVRIGAPILTFKTAMCGRVPNQHWKPDA